jgi:hypothetical protein
MKRTTRKKPEGAVLLVVLLIVMAITVLSVGFLSRSDVELACGENMILRAQMDYLAESGLEHARGLMLSPQDVDSEYWTGAVGQQLAEGSDDYYDVNVVKLGECNYRITCDAYRESNGERTGRSSLQAELRLDSCIAFCADTNATIRQWITITGDVNCNGTLTNNGTIDGDVFARGFSGNNPSGQQKSPEELSLQWPAVTVADFTSHYSVQPVGSSLSDVTYGPYNPVRVCYNGGGDVELNSNVQINGILAVEGSLTIRGNGNVIQAGKNVPVLLVTGDLIVENSGGLNVNGLVIVEGQTQISAGAANVSIVGGLFTRDGIVETTTDSSGNGNTGLLHNGPTWRPLSGQVDGTLEFDGADDYVRTADDAGKLQLTSNYTLGVWIKADAVQKDWASIFSKCNASGSANHWTLQFDNVSPKKLVVCHPVGSWDTGIRLGDVEGAWHHIRVVRNNGWMTSYLDGAPIHSNEWAETPGSGEGHLNVGADRTASSSYVYKGLIDDVRVYNRVPDANEVYPQTGLVGHWKLDEGGSSTVDITAAPLKTAIVVWPSGPAANWSSAGGAFFRSIERK